MIYSCSFNYGNISICKFAIYEFLYWLPILVTTKSVLYRMFDILFWCYPFYIFNAVVFLVSINVVYLHTGVSLIKGRNNQSMDLAIYAFLAIL